MKRAWLRSEAAERVPERQIRRVKRGQKYGSRVGNRRVLAIVVGLIVSLILLVVTVERRPQGDITRAVPFLLAALLLWAVVLGIAFGARRGLVVALVGGALFLLAAGLYVIFVPPIDFAECQQLFLELSNGPCRSHSDLGWAVLFLVGAVCCGAIGVIATRRREQAVH